MHHVTNEAINKVFHKADADFGHGRGIFPPNPRDVIRRGVLKYLCGYSAGSTITGILKNLGLVYGNRDTITVSEKGRAFVYDSFTSPLQPAPMNSPMHVLNLDRTDDELETFWIYCLLTAGKNADWAAKTTTSLLSHRGGTSPLKYFASLSDDNLLMVMGVYRTGQYKRLLRAFRDSATVNLRTASVHDLEKVFGVGPKTSRFFIMNTRRGAEYAILDTHLLKWATNRGCEHLPCTTPQNRKTYERVEKQVIECLKAAYPGLSLAEADLLVWATMSKRIEEDAPTYGTGFGEN